ARGGELHLSLDELLSQRAEPRALDREGAAVDERIAGPPGAALEPRARDGVVRLGADELVREVRDASVELAQQRLHRDGVREPVPAREIVIELLEQGAVRDEHRRRVERDVLRLEAAGAGQRRIDRAADLEAGRGPVDRWHPGVEREAEQRAEDEASGDEDATRAQPSLELTQRVAVSLRTVRHDGLPVRTS